MGLNMLRVYVRELMCEMYCGVMTWLTRVGDLRERERDQLLIMI